MGTETSLASEALSGAVEATVALRDVWCQWHLNVTWHQRPSEEKFRGGHTSQDPAVLLLSPSVPVLVRTETE